jgi:hypothetical protein
MYLTIFFFLAIAFVLTYDPKSRTLEKFIGQPTPSTEKSCQPTHYEAVQFGQTAYQCPSPGKTKMGAVM